jgi:hypothetical protein
MPRFRAKTGAPQISLAPNPQMIDLLVDNRAIVFKYLERAHKTKIQLMEDESSNFDEFRVFSTKTGEELTLV